MPTELHQKELLEAAECLFAEKGFDGTTTRQIARKAKCNVALINYHFGGKQGLYQSVLLKHFESFEEPEEERDLSQLLFSYAKKIMANPRIQKIIAREILNGGKRAITTVMKSENSFYTHFLSVIEILVKKGHIRNDFDVRMAAIGLMGPVIYCAIASPLIRGVYEFDKLDDVFIRDLCAHLVKTFFDGHKHS